MPLFFLPRPKSCCFCIKNLTCAAICIALFGLVEGLITVLLFLESCNSLYTASGHLGIAMLIWIGCTTTLGIFLIISSICFFVQIFLKLQCADNLFIWLLILVPVFNIVYFILTILRVTVDRVHCLPFVYDNKVQEASLVKLSGNVYLMFVSLAIAGLSIYFAFVANAYSCDLEHKRRSSMSSQPRRDLLPDCLRNHVDKMRGIKTKNKIKHVQEYALNIVSTEDHFKGAHRESKIKRMLSARRKKRKHSIASISTRSLRFQDDTSDSNDTSYETDKYYVHNDYNRHNDHNKHEDHMTTSKNGNQ